MGNSCKKLERASSAKRTLSKGYDLQSGTYVAFVKVDFNDRWEKEFDINLAVYA